MKRLFLLGPSGAGKSSYARKLSEKESFLWLELDRFPEPGDPIDHFHLRAEWNAFYERKDSRALISQLDHRASAKGCGGWVMTFASFPILTREHAAMVGSEARIAYLSGNSQYFLRDFLEREQRLARGLDADHWKRNNSSILRFLDAHRDEQFLVPVFDANGARLSDEIIIDHLLCRS